MSGADGTHLTENQKKRRKLSMRLHQGGWKSMCSFSRVRAAPPKWGIQFVGQLGTFSTASVTTSGPPFHSVQHFCLWISFLLWISWDGQGWIGLSRSKGGFLRQRVAYSSTLCTHPSRRKWCIWAFITTERLFGLTGEGRRISWLHFWLSVAQTIAPMWASTWIFLFLCAAHQQSSSLRTVIQ